MVDKSPEVKNGTAEWRGTPDDPYQSGSRAIERPQGTSYGERVEERGPSSSTLRTALQDAGLSETDIAHILESHTTESTAGDEMADLNPITVLVAEEQRIFREAYVSFFALSRAVEVLAVCSEFAPDTLMEAAGDLDPDVLLIGVRQLSTPTVEQLEIVHEQWQTAGLVVLSSAYEPSGLQALRSFSSTMAQGYAYLLKSSIDTTQQIESLIRAVADGRIILDPAVVDSMLARGGGQSSLVRELTGRELEVLSWIAKGYRNEAIAAVLARDLKTVERHINNIYNKLGAGHESKHSRVAAVLIYLKATGQMPSDLADDS